MLAAVLGFTDKGGSTIQPTSTHFSVSSGAQLKIVPSRNGGCPTGCELALPETAGDPKFTYNGTTVSFWMENDDKLKPLLSWPHSNEKDDSMSLTGKTFQDAQKSQWFDRFVVSKSKQTVVDVSDKEGNMHVMFMGEEVPAHADKVEKDGITIWRHKEDEVRVRCEMEGRAPLGMRMWASRPNNTNTTNFAHLNVDFGSLPMAATGLFAELAGIRNMTKNTLDMLKGAEEYKENFVQTRAQKQSCSCPA